MGKPEARRPDYSLWFADVAATPKLSRTALVVACRVGAIGLGVNSCGRRLYFEGTRKLEVATGIGRRNIQKALAELIDAGLIGIAEKGGGRGRSTRYELHTNGAERAAFVAAAEKGVSGDADSGEKGRSQERSIDPQKGVSGDAVSPETACETAETACESVAKRRAQTRPNPKKSKKNGPAPPLEAADAALRKPNPNPPTAEELAARRRMLKAQARHLVALEGGQP